MMMNAFAQPMRLVKRLWSIVFHADTPSKAADPYEKYEDRIPNRASRRALKELESGDLKTYESVDDLFADLDDD